VGDLRVSPRRDADVVGDLAGIAVEAVGGRSRAG